VIPRILPPSHRQQVIYKVPSARRVSIRSPTHHKPHPQTNTLLEISKPQKLVKLASTTPYSRRGLSVLSSDTLSEDLSNAMRTPSKLTIDCSVDIRSVKQQHPPAPPPSPVDFPSSMPTWTMDSGIRPRSQDVGRERAGAV